LSGAQPTGFQRAIVYGLLTFLVSSLLLYHFGFDLRAILTTSAILTAAVGLAMQPTLSTVIAGLAVHSEGIVRLGDGIMHDGELARVVSLNWRSIAAQKADGYIVVFPNSLISDRVTEIVRQDQPYRVQTMFHAPMSVPPQRISDLVTEMVSDFAGVDASLPVAVAPVGSEPAHAAIHYRVRYRILNYTQRGDLDGEVLRRLWYVFQRNGIALPVSRLFPQPLGDVAPIDRVTLRRCVRDALAAGGARALGLEDGERRAEMLADGGRLLLYAPDERLMLPDATDGGWFLLIRGEVVQAHEFGLDAIEFGRPVLPAFRLGPDAAVRRVAERLASYIGPYAEIAVRLAARGVTDLAEVCRVVSEEIDDPAARARFLAEVEPVDVHRHGPGLVFRARRNAAGALISQLSLRAQTEVAILALPPDLLSTGARLAAE
jgi:Mechanosensitive ion channel